MTDEFDKKVSTDDLRANASNWTLAGDVALLAHLQKFSSNLIGRVEETESALSNLVNSVEETSAKLNNISNQFLALQNSQFMENRVYDDDSPMDEPVPQVSEEAETQQQTLARYKEAVVDGLALLDTHFEQIDVPPESSDSEEESPESSNPLILRPKIPYSKPLPLLIGSAEWWADDSVGLGDYQENEDSETEEQTQSDSEHMDRPPLEKRYKHSSSSSSSSSDPVPVVHTRPFEPAPFVPPPLSSQPPPIVRNTLNDGRVFRTEDLFGDYNTRRSSGIFGSDESLNAPKKDLFSPAENLFDDPPARSQVEEKVSGTNDLFSKIPTSSSQPEASAKTAEKVSAPPSNFVAPTADEDLFGEENLVLPKPVTAKMSNAFTKELVAKLGSVVQNQEAVQKTAPKKAEPPGNLKKNEVEDLFKDPVPAQRSINSDVKPVPKPAETTKPVSKPIETRKPSETGKPISQPVEDLFKNPLPAERSLNNNVVSKPAETSKPVSKPPAKKVPDLFGDDDDDDDDLFGPPNKSKSVTKTGLFDDSPRDLFGERKNSQKSGAGTKNLLLSQETTSKKSSLFDGDLFADDDGDDLFSPASRPSKVTFSNSSGTPETTRVIKSSTPAAHAMPPSLNGPKPPDDLFGGLSAVDDSAEISKPNNSSLFQQDSNLEDNDADNAMVDSSKDLGFIGNTNVSENTISTTKDTSRNWFQPQLSSTQAAPASTNETSGYKTATLTSSPLLPDRRVSSIISERTETNQSSAVPTQNDSSMNSDRSKSISHGLFSEKVEESGESHQKSKTEGVHDTGDLFGSSTDELFGSSSKKRTNNLTEESKQKEKLSSKPETKASKPSIFDDDDDDLFSGKSKAGDDLSTSSSMFEEKGTVKSTLSNVFAKKQATSNSLFDDSEDEGDLFSSKKNVGSREKAIEEEMLGGRSKEKSSNPENAGSSLSNEKEKLKEVLHNNDGDLFSSKKISSIESRVKGEEKDSKPEVARSSFFNEREKFENILQRSQGDALLGVESKDASSKIEDSSVSIQQEKQPENVTPKPQGVSKLLKDETETVIKSQSHSLPPGISQKLPEIETNVKPSGKPKPPTSLPVTKTSDLLKTDQPDGEVANLAVKKKIGKLNIPMGLNINTAALLPGAKPKKSAHDVESTSAGLLDKKSEDSKPEEVSGPANRIESSVTSERTGSSSSSGDLLHSTLRDRARIQVKRRPQSRKARHEALRFSGIDFNDQEDEMVSPASNATQFYSAENTPSSDFASPKSNPLSTSTDGEDSFQVPALDSAGDKDGLFQKDVLFGVPPVLSPSVAKADSRIPEKSAPTVANVSLVEEKEDVRRAKKHPSTLETAPKAPETSIPVSTKAFEETFEKSQAPPKTTLEEHKARTPSTNLFDEVPPITAEVGEEDDLFCEVEDYLSDSEPANQENSGSVPFFDEVPPIVPEEHDDLFSPVKKPLLSSNHSKTDQSLPTGQLLREKEKSESASKVHKVVESQVPGLRGEQVIVQPVEKKPSQPEKQSDRGDDLFGEVGKTPATKEVETVPEKVPSKATSQKKNVSLFGEEEDDDDLFGGSKKVQSSSSSTSGIAPKDVPKKLTTSGSEKAVKEGPIKNTGSTGFIQKVAGGSGDDEASKEIFPWGQPAKEKEVVGSVKQSTNNPAEEPKDEIFKKVSLKMNVKEAKKEVKSIFDDDDDDDLFSTSQAKKPAQKLEKKASLPVVAKGKTESLFGESDDEIFSSKTITKAASSNISHAASSSSKAAPPAASKAVVNEEHKDSFVDPLGLLGKD